MMLLTKSVGESMTDCSSVMVRDRERGVDRNT